MIESTGTPIATPNADPAQTEQNLATGAPGAQPVGGDPTKSAAQEAMRKHKLKVDGQEIEVDDEELKRGYTHQKAANKKLQEGLRAKKQAEEMVRLLKTDPLKVLSDPRIGHDVRKLAEEYLASQLEDEMLDPREKELRQYKKELAAYKESEKKKQDDELRKRDQALKAKYSEDYTNQFVDALKTTGLPATKGMVAEMAKYIHRAAGMKFEMTAKEAAQLVREDIEMAHRNLYGEADAETLVKLIGEQGLAKVRTFDTSRLKDPNSQLKTPETQGEPNTRKRNSGKRMSPQEWRDFNRK